MIRPCFPRACRAIARNPQVQTGTSPGSHLTLKKTIQLEAMIGMIMADKDVRHLRDSGVKYAIDHTQAAIEKQMKLQRSRRCLVFSFDEQRPGSLRFRFARTALRTGTADLAQKCIARAVLTISDFGRHIPLRPRDISLRLQPLFQLPIAQLRDKRFAIRPDTLSLNIHARLIARQERKRDGRSAEAI